MIRYIVCPKCAHKGALSEEGYWQRVVKGMAKKPEHLTITTITAKETTIEELPVMKCDFCNADIRDGTPCVALTYWREGPEPQFWEAEYLEKEARTA